MFDIDYAKCWKCSIESSFLGDLIFDGVKQIMLEGIYIYIYSQEEKRVLRHSFIAHFRYNGKKFLSQMWKVDI